MPPAFQSYFGFEVFKVAPDARDSGELVARSENHGDILGFQIAGYTRAIVTVAVADIMHMEIEMVAPEKWRHHEGLVPPSIFRAAVWPCVVQRPVLDAIALARVGPPGDVRRPRKCPARWSPISLTKPVISGEACFFQQLCVRTHTNPDDDQIAV